MRRQLLLLTLILSLSISTLAQEEGTFEVHFNYTSDTGAINSLSLFSGHILNIIPDSIDIRMSIKQASTPSDWGVAMCDKNRCYPIGVTSADFILEPFEGGYLGVDFWLGSIAGSGTAIIRIENKADTSENIEILFTVTLDPVTNVPTLEDDVFILSQNYPNPFSDITRIDYVLSADKPAAIIITDITGKVISRYDLTSREGTIVFRDTKSAGIYFYSLMIDNRVIATKRMQVN